MRIFSVHCCFLFTQKNAAPIHKKFSAVHEDNTVSDWTVHEWFQYFCVVILTFNYIDLLRPTID